MAKDILLDDDNDLWIENGDFVIGDSEYQEIKSILQAVKNDYKMKPEIGVNLIEELNGSSSSTKLAQKIKLNLAMDGKEGLRFTIENGEIKFYE